MSFRSNVDAKDRLYLEHLDLLIGFIQTTYKSTAQRLSSLLAEGEITYDLLWALVRPNSTVYTTCPGTKKPRCVIYDSGEEKEISSGSKYFNMECRYLDYDGQVFREASIDIPILLYEGYYFKGSASFTLALSKSNFLYLHQNQDTLFRMY